MTDIDIAHPSHNPFDIPRQNKNTIPIFIASFLGALLLNGLIFYYAGTTKFKPNYKTYSEEKVTAEILHPPAPPPPPPPPKVPDKPPPLQPRPPAAVPINIPAPATFNVPPVEHPVPPPAPPIIAQEKPAPKPTITTHPDWLRRPDADDMARYYPDRAQRMSVDGHATIECTVNVNGTVSDCQVTAESPADQGFGDAALKLSKLFKMKPTTTDGVPVANTKVIIPIGFQIPKD